MKSILLVLLVTQPLSFAFDVVVNNDMLTAFFSASSSLITLYIVSKFKNKNNNGKN